MLTPALLAHANQPFDLASNNCGTFIGMAAPPGSKGARAFEGWQSVPDDMRAHWSRIRVDAYARELVELYQFKPATFDDALAWGIFELPQRDYCFCLWTGGDAWARSRSGLMRVNRNRVVSLWRFD